MPGAAGECHLGFGGAALIRSTAAKRIVCFFTKRAARRAVRARLSFSCLCTLLLFVLPAISFAGDAATNSTTRTKEDAANSLKGAYLFHASLDKSTLEENFEDFSGVSPQSPANNGPQETIERIDFDGNRRIRRDTLQARIFSRAGDVYNEDTLKRDFQA